MTDCINEPFFVAGLVFSSNVLLKYKVIGGLVDGVPLKLCTVEETAKILLLVIFLLQS